MVSFYPTHNVTLSECLNCDLFYQYNLHYMHCSKTHKLHGDLNNVWLDKSSPLFNHLAKCNLYQYTLTLHSSPWDYVVTLTNQDILEHVRTTAINIVRIIDKAENWAELYFLGSLNTKWKKPLLNTGIKAVKKLVLFS